MNVTFLMPIFNERTIVGHDVASHAANEWTKGLCGALQSSGCEVRLLGHEPARVWPLGCHLLPGDSDHLDNVYDQRLIRYVNVPLARSWILCHGYQTALAATMREVRSAVVCTYNALPWQIKAAATVAGEGAMWFSFVLDDETVAQGGWSRYVRATQRAAGHVFVSQWAYEHAPVERKMLLEGGVEKWLGDLPEHRSPVPSVLYAGALSEAAGMRELLAMIDATEADEVEFWVCGKGRARDLERRASRDSRIRLLGFLSEADLEERLQSAWVFVNPRSATHAGCRMNFPSKLLRYLSYGKPVITVWTEGIPEDYRPVLQVVDPKRIGDPPDVVGRALAKLVKDTLAWGPERRHAARAAIADFLLPGRLWTTRARELSSFMEQASQRAPAAAPRPEVNLMSVAR